MRRQNIFLVAAGITALVAALVVYSALKKREAMVQQAIAKNVEIVVAAHNLPLGTKIEPSDITLARWSRDSLPPGAFTDPKVVLNAFVKNEFIKGEPIITEKLFVGQKTAGVMPLLIPAGMRAMSVPVDEVADIAGFVLPHTHVDVLVAVSNQGENQKPFSKIVLQNVEVLAVAQEIEHTKDQPQVVKVVTLLVTPEEAERLALASREGTLRLAMRNYNDSKVVLTSGVDVHDLMSAYRADNQTGLIPTQRRLVHHLAPQPKPIEVQVMRNGKDIESLAFVKQQTTDNSALFWKVDGSSADKNGKPKAEAEVPTSFVTPPGAATASSPNPGTKASDANRGVTNGDTPSPGVSKPAHPAETAFNAPIPKTIDVP